MTRKFAALCVVFCVLILPSKSVADAISWNMAFASYTSENTRMSVELGEITNKIYVAEMSLVALGLVQDYGEKLPPLLQSFSEDLKRITLSFADLQQRNLAWFREAVDLAESHRPPWYSVVDLPSYRSALAQILAYERQLPLEGMIPLEEQFLREAADVAALGWSVRQVCRELAFGDPLVIYGVHANAVPLVEHIHALDDNLARGISLVEQAWGVVLQQRNKRLRTVSDTARAWREVLNAALNAANASQATSIIEAGERTEYGGMALLDVQKIAQSTRRASVMLNVSLSPLHGQRLVMADMQRLGDVLGTLHTRQIDEASKSAILALASQTIAELKKTRAQIAAACTSGAAKYRKERHRILTAALTAPVLTSTCKTLAEAGLRDQDAFAEEGAFINYRASCL